MKQLTPEKRKKLIELIDREDELSRKIKRIEINKDQFIENLNELREIEKLIFQMI